MDWILRRLACGSFDDALTVATSPVPIDRILSLSERAVPHGALASTTHAHHEPIPDETWLPPDLWTKRVETLRVFLNAGATVLVHCRLGVSRAPALCAAYLIHCGMAPDEARQFVEARRAVASMHPKTWQGVVEWSAQR